jgi:phage gp36-like protein
MANQQLKSQGEQLKQSLDKITQAGGDQQKIQQAVQDAKTKIDQFVQQADQGSQGQQR